MEQKKQQIENTSKQRTAYSGETEPELDGLQDDLRTFRHSLYANAERPNAFWAKQRTGIMEKLQRPVSGSGYKIALLLASAAMIVLLCLTPFVEKNKALIPDFAAGADQELLIEVERALSRNYSDVFIPAAILSQEIDRTDTTIGPTSNSK